MNISGHIFPNDAVGYFRIASPTRRQPIEPVTVGSFLLGSGSSCHLRFGDESIPGVHTELTVEPGRVMMLAKTSDPPVYVNGSVETECRLYDGDLLELGPERLLFRFSSAEQRITLNEQEFLAGIAGSGSPSPYSQQDNNTVEDSAVEDRELQSLTVETLVERLEEQVNLVEELTKSDQDDLANLIRTVAAASESSVESSQQMILQNLMVQMSDNQQSNRSTLDSMTEVLNKVVQQQKLIADSLQALGERVLSFDSAQNSDVEFSERKAS